MKKRTLCCALITGMAVLMTGCGTSAGENASKYFEEVAEVTSLWAASQKNEIEENDTDAGNRLESPGNFVLSEDGSYSFTGVENAEYYLMYFCAEEAVNDGDAFIYSSDTIDATGNGGETYSGNISDLLQYGYGKYLVKVFAFPSVNDSEYSMSAAATARFTCSGAQDAPIIAYLWNTFEDTVDVQLSNIDVYEYQSYPESVEVTFTNTADAGDQVVVTIEGLSADNYNAVSDALTRGNSYDISAICINSSEYVTNNTSDTTEVAKNVTFSDSNVMSDNYYYADGIARNTFNFLQVCDDFNLAEGGDMNEIGTSMSYTYTAEPIEAEDGCAYSYHVTADGTKFDMDYCSLNLYTDGTLFMGHTTAGWPGTATMEGSWVDNGDGTATLSFNHATLIQAD